MGDSLQNTLAVVTVFVAMLAILAIVFYAGHQLAALAFDDQWVKDFGGVLAILLVLRAGNAYGISKRDGR